MKRLGSWWMIISMVFLSIHSSAQLNVNFTFSPDSSCSGNAVQFTALVSGGDSTKYIFDWNFNDNTPHSSEKNPTHIFDVFGCSLQPKDVMLTVTDTTFTNIQQGSQIKFVNVRGRPVPLLSDPLTFSNCDNHPTPENPDFTVTVSNITQDTSCLVPNNFSINWGDGVVSTGLSAHFTNVQHTYHRLGVFSLELAVSDIYGCEGKTTYWVGNESPPMGTFDTIGTYQAQCAPVIYRFRISGIDDNSPETKYRWKFGDGTEVLWNHDSVVNNDSIISHTYLTSSCNLPGSQFTVRLEPTNTCGTSLTEHYTAPVYAKGKAMIDTAQAKGCIGDEIQFTNLSTTGYGDGCSPGSTYYWDFGNGHTFSGTVPPPQTYSAKGNYDLMLINMSYCGNDTLIWPVRIDSLPYANATPQSVNNCIPKEVTFLDHSTGGNLRYTWTVTPAQGWHFISPTNEHSAEPTLSFDTYLASGYQVTLRVENNCIQTDDTTFTINVANKPTATLAHPPNRRCAPYYYTPQVSYEENGSPFHSYHWKFEGAFPDSSLLAHPDSILYTQSGTFRVILKAANDCDTVTLIDSISIISYVPITLQNGDTSICRNEPSFRLQATPTDGSWFGSIVSSSGWVNTSYVGVFKCLYIRGYGECESRDSIYIIVKPLPEVFAGNDRGMCISDEPINLSEFGATYSNEPWWSGSGITDNILGTFDPGISGAGTFIITLKVTDTATYCFNFDYINITVDPYPIPDFVADTFCVGINKQFVNTTTGGYSYSWNFGDDSTSSLPNPFHVYADTGEYKVLLIVSSRYGCVDSIEKTIHVIFPPPQPFFTISYNPPSQCGPVDVRILFDHSMYNNQVSYRWNFGNGSIITSRYSFSDTTITYYQGVIADTTYHITVDLIINCGVLSESLPVEVRTMPVARFMPNTHIGCSPLRLRISNTSRGLPVYNIWSFGDNTPVDTISSKIFEHVFYNESGDAVTYYLLLKTVNGCGRDSITDSITVYPNFSKAFISYDNNMGCPPHTVHFHGDGSQGGYRYDWEFGDGGVSHEMNPTYTYTSSGIYRARLLVSGYDTCSKDTVSTLIHVSNLPVINFSMSSDSVCIGEEIQFTNLSEQLSFIRWNFGDSTFSNQSNPTHVFQFPGWHTIWLAGTSQLLGCSDSISKSIFVKTNPTAAILNSAEGCEPLTVTMEGDAGTYHLWNFGDGTPWSSNPEHTYLSAGDFNVTLISEWNNGCRDTAVSVVRVFRQPASKFTLNYSSANTNINGLPATLQLTNKTTFADRYEWDFGNGDTSNVENPVATFNSTGNYLIRLTASNQYGCYDTSSVVFNLFFYRLYIPNALKFSSGNPEDQKFTPKGYGILKYHIAIYNRWDNLLWESDKIQDGQPAESWDGTINGQRVPEGTYFWIIKELLFENGSTRPGNDFKSTGTITVIY